MSGYLWGIGQLVNDPSTHLISAIHKHIFKREYVLTAASETIRSERPSAGIIVSSSTKNVANKSNDSGCVTKSNSKKVCELPCVKSESVQVGGITRRRHVSTQCHGSVCKKLSRTTSVRQLDQLDRGTVVSYTACTVTFAPKDAETNTEQQEICDEHRHVFAALREWSSSNNDNDVKSKPSVLSQMIASMNGLADFFRMGKIETIPPYRPQEKQTMHLYKSASIANVAAHGKKSKKHRKKMRN